MILSRLIGAPMLLTAALAVAGCGSVPGTTPVAMGSLPPDAPARPAEQAPFPNVYDAPARPAKLMTEEEQTRLEAELTALRKRVNSRADGLEKEKIGDNR